MEFTYYWKIKGINIKKLQKYIMHVVIGVMLEKQSKVRECLGVW